MIFFIRASEQARNDEIGIIYLKYDFVGNKLM